MVMKIFYSALMIFSLAGVYSCDRTNDNIGDDLSIERQEDFERDHLRPRDEIEVDRDIIGDDEIELND
jgi:hypothetical protein